MRSKTRQRIAWINALFDQFDEMTLRQIYYQLVPKGLNYRQVQYACKVGREKGLIPWDNIVDRSRPAYSIGRTFPGVDGFLTAMADYFHLDYWNGSQNHIEIWTEKDALSQIIKEVAKPHQVTVRVTKGFLSLSNKARWGHDDLSILYFGDFDPSGLFIDKDLQWSNLAWGDFERKALTTEQIQEYDLPSVKVNRRDPRAKEYIPAYGTQGWELDALPPDVLQQMVQDAIREHVDFDLEQKREEERKVRRKIRRLTLER